MEPVGVAIIGLGYGLTRASIVQSNPETRLVALAGRTRSKVDAAAEQFGVAGYADYRELLARDDVEIVGLYTPTGTHAEIAETVASSGKHLVVTKPLDLNVDRADRIIAACEASGVRLATEYIFRYTPSAFDTHQRIHDGELGRPIIGEFSYKCYRSQAYYDSDGGWRGTWEVDGGGALMNKGIHLVDQMLWMMGPAESVTAHADTYTHQIETEDTLTALVRFRSGALGVLVATTTFHNNQPAHTYGNDVRRIEVHGSLGSIGLTEWQRHLWAMASSEPEPSAMTPPASNVFQDMARWVRDPGYQSPTLATGSESRKAVAFIQAAYESARNGATVRMS